MIVSEHELSEIRGLIEQRSGILFDSSRERFFSSRVREHLDARKLAHGTDLLRLIKSSNVEYDTLLQKLLTHRFAGELQLIGELRDGGRTLALESE